VWDVATGERLHRLQGHVGGVRAVGFGVGTQLYTSGSDGSTIQWDLDRSRGPVRHLLQPRFPHQSRGVPLLSPSASSVLVSWPGQAASGEPALELMNTSNGALTQLPASGQQITWAAYRPDGRQVATVALDGSVQLWDIQTATKVAEQPGRGDQNWGAIAFTPDGTRILVADQDAQRHRGRVTELDAHTLQPTGRGLDLAIAPVGIRATRDGIFAVTADRGDLSEGTDVVFADLDDRRIFHRHQIPIPTPRANFSPDGRLYAYGGFDGRVGMIEVASGRVIQGSRDPVHDGPANWVTFSPDSSTLASVGVDGQVTLLDTTHAVPFARLQPGEPNLEVTASYRPDGHTLVLAYEDGSVISFDTDPTAWERHACTVAGRNLTQDEWHDAFGDRPYRQTCPQP
jgi:WD40 repeat protein